MRRQPLRSQRRRPESSLRSFPARFVRPSLLVSLCLIMWAAASSLALADGSVAPPLFGGDPSRHTGAQSPGGPGLIGGGVGASGSSLATHEVDGYRLYVVVSESVILNARNVQRVAVADPAIADVAVATHSEVLINGVSPGRTTLHVWDAQGRTSFAIRVYEDAAEMAREIEHRIADPGVFVWVVKGSVILEGEVADPVARERAVKIAGAYSERVIDLLRAPTPDVASMRAEAVREALDDPRIRVTVINETILIEGIVDSPQEKERASAVAKAFGHPVVDLVRVREAHASDALDQVVQEAIGDPSVRVSLHGEILVLEGTVHTELQRRRAETLAKAYADRVESFIEVQPAEPLTDSFDPLRPSLRDEIVRAIANPAIHVHIFGDTVFLEGHVNEEHAKERAKAIALAFHDKVVDLLRIDELAVPALAPTLLTPPSSTGEGAGIGVNTDSDTGTATDVGPGAGDRSGVTRIYASTRS